MTIHWTEALLPSGIPASECIADNVIKDPGKLRLIRRYGVTLVRMIRFGCVCGYGEGASVRDD